MEKLIKISLKELIRLIVVKNKINMLFFTYFLNMLFTIINNCSENKILLQTLFILDNM